MLFDTREGKNRAENDNTEMKSLVPAVILLSIFSKTVSGLTGSCHYPSSWQYPKRWLTGMELQEQSTDHVLHMYKTYEATTSYISSEPDAGYQLVNYKCTDFLVDSTDPSQTKYYYARYPSDSPNSLECIEEIPLAHLMLHREAQQDLGDASAETCQRRFSGIPRYSIYLPLATVSTQLSLSLSDFKCPFARGYYRVSYSEDSSNVRRCNDDVNSVATVQESFLNILTCNKLFAYETPYTGLLQCLGEFSPTVLGEADDSNGKIIILSYLDRGRLVGFYCGRYRVDQSGFDLSLDVTERRTPQCQYDARYDQYGNSGSTKYRYFRFSHISDFTTRTTMKPTTSTTTTTPKPPATPAPTPTPRPTPGASQPDPLHVQFTLTNSFDEFANDVDEIKETLERQIPSALSFTPSRLSQLDIEKGRSGNMVVTFDLGPGTSVVHDFERILLTRVFNDPTSGRSLEAKPGFFYVWKDTDPCPDAVCDNGGLCWVREGAYDCLCASDWKGATCTEPLAASEGDSTQMLIIIVVCCVVAAFLIVIAVVCVCLRHCRKDKGVESPYYDGGGSVDTETRDKEIYSTISKKPTAFHDKQFVGGSTLTDRSGMGHMKSTSKEQTIVDT